MESEHVAVENFRNICSNELIEILPLLSCTVSIHNCSHNQTLSYPHDKWEKTKTRNIVYEYKKQKRKEFANLEMTSIILTLKIGMLNVECKHRMNIDKMTQG